MSAAGILRPDEVVFYHPLDNLTEHTQGQAWTGIGAGQTGGKLPDASPTGMSAVAADALSFGAEYDTDTTVTSVSMWATLVWLDSTRVFVLDHSIAVCATVSGMTVSLGNIISAYKICSAVAVDDGSVWRVAVNYDANNSVGLYTIDKTTTAATWNGYTTVPAGTLGRMAGLGGGKILMATTGGGDAFIATLTGTSFAFGSTYNYNASSPTLVHAIGLSSSTVVIAWSNASIGRACVATVSGTDITYGAESQFSPANISSGVFAYYRGYGVKIDGSRGVLAYRQTAVGGSEGAARVFQVSGSDITFGDEAVFHASDGNGAMYIFLGQGTTSTIPLSYCTYNNGTATGTAYSRMLSVSGAAITVGGASSPRSPASGTFDAAIVLVESGDKAVMMYRDPTDGKSKIKVGQFGMEAALTAPTPAAYPAATGDDRVVVAMWARNVTKGSSTVVVQRDYRVELTGATVALGPASATWGSVAALGAGQMNDGSAHLLVLDFEHTGGGSWNLKTSLDGGAWVDEGAGTGTRSTAPASLAPGLSIADGESGQWIDELVMWAGDEATFDIFTTQELLNLNDLADTFGEAMDQFEENFGAPICWQATARMPDGTVWRDSGSGPCPPVVRVPRGAEDVVVTDDGMPASPRIVGG